MQIGAMLNLNLAAPVGLGQRRRGFLPTDIPGLKLWLSASRGLWQDAARTVPATADGDPVAAWEDLSGNGSHATQGTASKRPMLSIVSGLNRISFDGVDDSLTHNNAMTLRSVVASCNFEAAAFVNYQSLLGGGVIAGQSELLIGGASGTAFYPLGLWGASTNTWVNGIPTNDFAPLPTRKTVISVGAASESHPLLRLGTGRSTPETRFWKGSVTGIAIYSTALSAAQRQLLQEYFA